MEADAAILTVPLPLLHDIELPPAARAQAAVSADIGFGNVVKICCDSQRDGGPPGVTSPTCRFSFQMQRFQPGGHSIRRAIRS
jgi:hypothetical protein